MTRNRLQLDVSLVVNQRELESLKKLDSFMSELSEFRTMLARRIERKLDSGGSVEPGPLRVDLAEGKLIIVDK